MSSQASDRAAVVRALPHVRRWVARFKRLAREMPPEVEVLVMAGVPSVLALDGDGHSFEKGGRNNAGADQDAIVGRALAGRWDGGDW